jgi:ABC-type arginine/histidine transport system permease subunit
MRYCKEFHLKCCTIVFAIVFHSTYLYCHLKYIYSGPVECRDRPVFDTHIGKYYSVSLSLAIRFLELNLDAERTAEINLVLEEATLLIP